MTVYATYVWQKKNIVSYTMYINLVINYIWFLISMKVTTKVLVHVNKLANFSDN